MRTPGAFTIDSILAPGEGSYAVVPPRDPVGADGKVDADRERRRKKQREAFESVQAVDGDGPFAYYNGESVWILGGNGGMGAWDCES